MAYFAKLDQHDIVLQILVVDDDLLLSPDGTEDESIGVTFLKEVAGSDFDYVQTWIDGQYRGEYASIDGNYNRELGVFEPPVNPELQLRPAPDHAQPSGAFEWS